jgi:hypothetical protein
VLLEPRPQALFAEQALPIARLDAAAAYGDLDAFRITIARQPDGWHIDDELLDAMHDRGGPHYVIDARSGKILATRYDQ